MKKLLLALLLALCAVPAQATWTLVQHPSNTGCVNPATTCAVTTTSTGAGHLIVVVGIIGGASTATITGVTNTGGSAMTFTHCTCAGVVSGQGAIDAWYSVASTSSNTSFTATFSAAVPVSGGGIVEVMEYSSTTTFAFDTQGETNVSSAAPVGVALTLTGSNDVLVQWAFWSGTLSGTPAPYTAIAEFPSGNVISAAINSASGTAPAFTPTTSGSGPFAALAFKETVTVSPRGKAINF